MSDLKNKIKSKLQETTLNEKRITPDELTKNTDELVKAAKDSLDIDDKQAKDYVSGLVGETISDLSQINAALQDAREDWDMQLGGVVERSLKSFGLPDEVVLRILVKMQNAYWDAYDEVRRANGGNWDNMEEAIDEYNKEVMAKMKDQYGDEAGERVYYATANKQDRDPETFHTEVERPKVAASGNNPEPIYRDSKPKRPLIKQEDTGEDYGDIGMQDIEVGADKYEEYRKLMQQLAAEEGQEGEMNEGGEQTNDPVKLKADVQKLMDKLDMSVIAPYLDKIDNPTEQAEVIAQFAEKIGVPKAKLSAVIAQLKTVAESKKPKMTKNQLIEAVTGKKAKKVIKTVKVKDIK